MVSQYKRIGGHRIGVLLSHGGDDERWLVRVFGHVCQIHRLLGVWWHRLNDFEAGVQPLRTAPALFDDPSGAWWELPMINLLDAAHDRFLSVHSKVGFPPLVLRPYLLSQSSGCGLWIRSRPSRIRLPPPAWTECRTCSCLGPRWWCPRPCPRSAATPRSGVRLRPNPRWPAASPRATDSSRRWPESSACLYISE